MRRAVQLIGGKALVEASGNVTLSTVKPISATGVDFISSGALTHSARAADISLKVTRKT
jgi:nicotinate-nucleotide pyrophosphorylase (carboxylating)